LANHRIRVDLAHIVAAIVLMSLIHMQQPRIVGVGDAVSRNPRYHMPVDGQYHLPVDVNPGHLPNEGNFQNRFA